MFKFSLFQNKKASNIFCSIANNHLKSITINLKSQILFSCISTRKESIETNKIVDGKVQNESFQFLKDKFIQVNRKPIPLLPPQDPKYNGKLTVVVEMDEVLFSTFVEDENQSLIPPSRNPDHYFESPDIDMCLSLYKRPDLEQFLEYLCDQTEPVLFTRGKKEYTDGILKLIDPNQTFVHILTQENCGDIIYPQANIYYLAKDIENLDRNLQRLVYIDTQIDSFWMSPRNGLIMSNYFPEVRDDDTSLKQLIKLLQNLEMYQDIRPYLDQQFNIENTLKQERYIE